MIQVVDQSGKPIPGLYKNDIGLCVQDPLSYQQYLEQREVLLAKDRKIEELEAKINKLFELLENK